jgi:predicted transcriptional regulator
MAAKNLIPYSVYLPENLFLKLKELAKDRKASVLIRDAIAMIIDGNDAYMSGYNKGVKDAGNVVYECPEAQMIAVKGKDLGAILTERIDALEMKK